MSKILVTGGAGYFGEILCEKLCDQNNEVRCLDLNPSSLKNVNSIVGNICDYQTTLVACRDVEIVYHNVAQVPLAKDAQLFDEVNRGGTEKYGYIKQSNR